MAHCQHCQKEIQYKTVGQKRQFCSAACKQKAYRKRKFRRQLIAFLHPEKIKAAC